MFTRTCGLLVAVAWISSMSWLVAHDVLPAWTAQDAPALKVTDWLETEGLETQSGIYDDQGRVGTIWTVHRIDENSTQRDDLVVVERFSVPIAPFGVSVDSIFTADGLLDEFTVSLATPDITANLHGERFHADFSFTLRTGRGPERFFKIPLTDAGMISGAFSPFAQLTDLKVGDSWRMQGFNPVAAVTGMGKRFIPMLVAVTGTERISTAEGLVSCLVIESPGVKAWVDDSGVVRRQEITLPIGGEIRIVPEKLNVGQREEAQRRFYQIRRESRS